MRDFVECPLCNKKFKSITNNHLTKKHSISLEDFRVMFPTFDTESEELRNRRSKINKENSNKERVRKFRSEKAKLQHESGNLNTSKTTKESWEKDRDLRIKPMLEAQKRPEVIKRKSEIMKERWKNPEYKDRVFSKEEIRIPKVSEASKKMWEIKREMIIESMLEAQKRPEVIKRKSEIMTERRKDESYNKRLRETMINLFNDEEWVKSLSKSQKGLTFHSKWYGDFHVRSSYESLVCEMLEELDLEYEYEKRKFKYTFEGKEHLYIVDFYVNALDLYLEVKPKVFEDKPKNQAKFNSVKYKGLNIIFIDEDVIFSIDDFNNKLYTSTTIRKQDNPINKMSCE